MVGPIPRAAAETQSAPTGPDLTARPEVKPGAPAVPDGLKTGRKMTDEEREAALRVQPAKARARELTVSENDFKNLPPEAGRGQRWTRGSRFDAEKSELVDQDEKSQTFENPDGTFTQQISQDVERMKGEDGSWRDVELTLESDGDSFTPKVGVVDVSIAKAADRLATLRAEDGESIVLGVPGADPRVAGRIDEEKRDRARFADLLPNGIDVEVRPTRRGVKSTYVVPTATAASQALSETLTLPAGWTAHQAGPEVEIKDTKGNVRFVWAGGPAFDAAAKRSSVDAWIRLVGQEGRVATAIVTLPEGWASSSDRVFPLTIDPFVQDFYSYGGSHGMDTFVRSDMPSSTAGFSSTTLPVGKSGSAAYRALLRFNTPTPNTQVGVIDAYLKLSRTSGDPCGVPVLYGRRVTSGWSSGTSWSNQPSAVTTDEATDNDCSGGYDTVQIDEMTQNWLDYDSGTPGLGADNIGILLQTNEATTDYITFASGDHATSSLRPVLHIDWSHRPGQSAQDAPGADVKLATTTPTLTSTAVSDPDGETVQYNFRISTGADESGMVTNSGWSTNNSFQVPDGALVDGATYYWNVATYDGYVTRNGASPRKFQVDLRLGQSSVSPMDSIGPVSVNLATGNVHTSTALRSAAAVGGNLGLSLNYNSQDASEFGLNGKYYLDPDANHAFGGDEVLAMSRRDPLLAFWWGNGSPAPIIPNDNFLVRWEGYVTAPLTGQWWFGLRHDDGVRMWVTPAGGTTVGALDDWNAVNHTGSAHYDNTKPVSLVAGARNKIVIEFYEAGGDASVELWAKNHATSPTVDQIVPSDWMFPDDDATPAGWSLSADVDAANSYLSYRDTGSAVILKADDGATTEFKYVNGDYTAPPDDDTIVYRNDYGLLVARDGAGRTHTFDLYGNLESVTSALDDRNPAAFAYTWSPLVGNGIIRLTRITDPVSGRYLDLQYSNGPSYTSPCPTAPSGMQTARVGFLDHVNLVGPTGGTPTTDRLACFYYLPVDSWGPGQLAQIAELGGEVTTFDYAGGPRYLNKITDPLNHDYTTGGFAGAGQTEITYSGNKASAVSLPTPDQVDPGPKHLYTYVNSTTTEIDVDSISTALGYFRKVEFDPSNRLLKDYRADGEFTTQTWNAKDQVTSVTDPTGLRTTTIYDWADRPISTYGPSPTSCFNTTTNLPNGSCTNPAVPHAQTAYDENMPGLATAYFNNNMLAGGPQWHGTKLTQSDGSVNASWTGSPAPGISADNWSLSATGDIFLAAGGEYTFETYGDDGARLYIDDKKIADGWGTAGSASGTFTNATSNSHHRIRLEFKDNPSSGTSQLQLWYKTPGNPTSVIVPGSILSPKYGLVTTTTDADNKVTKTEFAEPELGVSTATVVDPTGLNLRTETTYEPRSTTTFLRQLTKTLPKGAAPGPAGDYMTNYLPWGATATADNPCTPAVEAIRQSGLPRSTTDPDPDLNPGTPTPGPVTTEVIYDYPWGKPIATATNGFWSCITYDDRGRMTAKSEYPNRDQYWYYGDDWVFDPRLTLYHFEDTDGVLRTSANFIDSIGRAEQYADELNTITRTKYDRAGRPIKTYRTFDSPTPVEQLLTETNYATNGRVDWTKEYASGSARQTNYTYDGDGRPLATTLPNALSTTNAYDPNTGAVSSITHASSSTTLSKWNYQRSGAGRILSEAGQGRTRAFTYDGAGRLTQTTEGGVTRRYAFDKNTNRCANAVDCNSPTFTYDNADRIATSPGATYTYDARGNTTGITYSGSTSGTLADSYSFNAATSTANHDVAFTVGKPGPVSATATLTPTSTSGSTGTFAPSLATPGANASTNIALAGSAETKATVTWPQTDGLITSTGTWNLTTAGYTGTPFTPNTNGNVAASLTWSSINKNYAVTGPTLTNTTPWTQNVTVSANGQFKIHLSWPLQFFNDPDLRLDLIDGATTVASSNTSTYLNEREAINYAVTGLSAGQSRVYTVKVTKLSGASTGFTIGNDALGNPSQYPVTPTVGLELRNNATNALIGSGASSSTGTVALSGIPVANGTAYVLKATTTDNVTASQSQSIPNRAYAPLNIDFRSPTNTSIWSTTSSTGSVTVPAQFTTTGGTYTLRLTNQSTANASYAATPTANWTASLRGELVESGPLNASTSVDQIVTAAADGTLKADVTWGKETHEATHASVTVDIKPHPAGTPVTSSGPSTSGMATVSAAVTAGSQYKVVVTNNSSTQKIRNYSRVITMPMHAAITGSILDANGTTIARGTGGPNTVTVAANLAPGNYTLRTTPASGTGSVAVSGTYGARPASIAFGYDFPSDHNTSINDGTTTVLENLSRSGRVLRRIVKLSNTPFTVLEDITYGYDSPGDSPAYSKPTTGAPLTTYLDNGEIDVAGTVTYRHFNGHGDVIGTSTSTGAFTERIAADEYGLLVSTSADRMNWLGKQQRMETGIGNITRMGVRLYEPTTGRFLQADPIDGGSSNNYDYVDGEPVNDHDLGGTWSIKGITRFVKKMSYEMSRRNRFFKAVERASGPAGFIFDAVSVAQNWRKGVASFVTSATVTAVCGATVVGVTGGIGAAGMVGCLTVGQAAGAWVSDRVKTSKPKSKPKPKPRRYKDGSW